MNFWYSMGLNYSRLSYEKYFRHRYLRILSMCKIWLHMEFTPMSCPKSQFTTSLQSSLWIRLALIIVPFCHFLHKWHRTSIQDFHEILFRLPSLVIAGNISIWHRTRKVCWLIQNYSFCAMRNQLQFQLYSFEYGGWEDYIFCGMKLNHGL